MTQPRVWNNLPLRKMTFTRDCRCFKTGYEIEFTTPITLLVGEIGTGKSTLLDILRFYHGIEDTSYFKGDHTGEFKDVVSVESVGLAQDRVKYFDFHSGDRKFATSFGEGDAVFGQLAAMRASSGQGLALQFRDSGVIAAERSLILLDEIGRGASPRTQEVYAQVLMKLSLEKKDQIIASTHSERIMRLAKDYDELFCRLYSVEHKRHMGYDEFLEKHLKG